MCLEKINKNLNYASFGSRGWLLTMCFVCVYVEKSNQSDSVLLGNRGMLLNLNCFLKLTLYIFVLQL